MPHIHTNPGEHDHTVSFFIVRTDFSEPKLMLHRHKKIGKLMMFGGHVELNETPWQAVLHEVTEETGFSHSQLRILQPPHRIKHLTDSVLHPYPICSSTGPYPGELEHYHSDTAYAMTADSSPEKLVEGDESQDFILVTLSELLDLPEEQILSTWRQVGAEVLTYCLQEWESCRLEEFK